jgi:hypothetical protein
MAGKWRFNCLNWDGNGVKYCPEVQGSKPVVQFNQGDAKQRCTYDTIPRQAIFDTTLDKYFEPADVEAMKKAYCDIAENVTTSECKDYLDTNYDSKYVYACLGLLNGQQAPALHVYPWADDAGCKSAIIAYYKSGGFGGQTVAAGQIDAYCKDKTVSGDTNKTKGFFDPACSCVNMLDTDLSTKCAEFTTACNQVINAKQNYGPGCPAGCAERMKLDKAFESASTDNFVSQVKTFFDSAGGGKYCYTEACSGGRKEILMEFKPETCDGNIQACFIQVGNQSEINNSTINASCQQDMNITDNSGCQYDAFVYGNCVDNVQLGTRNVTHTPTGKTCTDTTTTKVCGTKPNPNRPSDPSDPSHNKPDNRPPPMVNETIKPILIGLGVVLLIIFGILIFLALS